LQKNYSHKKERKKKKKTKKTADVSKIGAFKVSKEAGSLAVQKTFLKHGHLEDAIGGAPRYQFILEYESSFVHRHSLTTDQCCRLT
jgi:hypothetical protein